MFNLNESIIFEYQNEHVLEHDLQVKKNFSAPKIYTANGNLDKRWYVYFSYRNPQTGKLERMKNIYGKSNNFKTKEERLSILVAYRKKLLQLLKAGFNPFEDNVALYQQKNKPESPVNEEQVVAQVEEPKMSVEEALNFGLKLKSKLIGTRTKSIYENRIMNFLKWMDAKYPEINTISDLTKKIVVQFLNEELFRTSARSRNNFRVDLSSLLQVLEDNEIIDQNFVKKIPILKSTPERNKTYTTERQEEIFNYLEEKDPILLLYIKFISYNFLRPIEVNRLKVGDINLKNKTIQFKAKNSPLKTKIIPELLIKDLPDLSKLNKDFFLFTPEIIGGEWDATENNRRDHFTKRFKKVVKEHFNLGADYGLYSFRHTYITKLYREIRKTTSPNEAKSHLMLITGHSSMSALEKYLRDIDAELPEDYSVLIKS